MKTVVTHNAGFHSDDVFGTATVLLYLEKKGEEGKIIRTFEQSVWEKADIVLDVGLTYDQKKNRFDHHQGGGAGVRANGTPYASFGLVWKKFGKELCGSQVVADTVDEKIVSYIDADDNAVATYKRLVEDVNVFTIDQYIRGESNGISNIQYAEKKDALRAFDKKFRELVEWAKKTLVIIIENAKEKVKLEKEANKVYEKNKDKRLMIMDKFVGYGFGAFPEPLYLVYPDLRTKARWCVKTVQEKDELFKDRLPLPKEWRGKFDEEFQKASGVKDARFCHNTGYIASADSKEGALMLAEKALKQTK